MQIHAPATRVVTQQKIHPTIKKVAQFHQLRLLKFNKDRKISRLVCKIINLIAVIV